MFRNRISFKTEKVEVSDIKRAEGTFVSNRKIERMREEFNGTLPASTETEATWKANTLFLANLVEALTTRARFSAFSQDPTLKTATSPQGVVELIHYASTNLAWRLANPQSTKTWTLEDCLIDYTEYAEFYGLHDFLDDALEMVAPSSATGA